MLRRQASDRRAGHAGDAAPMRPEYVEVGSHAATGHFGAREDFVRGAAQEDFRRRLAGAHGFPPRGWHENLNGLASLGTQMYDRFMGCLFGIGNFMTPRRIGTRAVHAR